MGMDVYGTAPTDPVGEYFRRSVWGWHPLIDITEQLCTLAGQDDLFLRCPHWHTNDGAGLGAEDALTLGTVIIEPALANGTVARLLNERKQKIAMAPNEPCTICAGTGIRTDAVGEAHGMPQKGIPPNAMDMARSEMMLFEERKKHPRAGQTGWCNACDGRGYSAPFATMYNTSEDGIREWSQFLKHCGGFTIC